ncbi:helix-turn-helix domain-containing protein [Chitinophaga japonensis]|uniref:AlpA family transcriptional regulator n=1 Tax=Chitinophaga japonensis TaxID=104662 RepID=A0A562T349_CHIJA|nr:helix-turn-helix domain-containing protein [Chitinophaga japonensis]TWI87758.1 AlpA family transcriptional regulator [Chitinophaga japonensis]
MDRSIEELNGRVEELHSKIDGLTSLIQKSISERSGESNETLNVKQVASLLGIKEQTVYDKVYKKQLPAYKKGKHLLFYKVEMDEFIASGRLLPSADMTIAAEQYLRQKNMRDRERKRLA